MSKSYWDLETIGGSNEVKLSIFYDGKKRAQHSFTDKDDIDNFVKALRRHYVLGFVFDENGK